ncbi:MAG: ABC transporter substrate-binding protein [Streptosporangiaceae bacterium]|jgi:branched-chain amino acid transport system substrate-binding protein
MPDRTITRRNALTAAGATATGGVLAACSSSIKGTSSTTTRELKIGWLHPLTGSEASFGSADTFVLSKIRATPQYSNGFSIGGKTWKVTVISYDSQSSPTVAGDLAHQAINSDGVDMLVASSTPETVTPVANAGEALGVPVVCTDIPWESWYTGLGGNLANPVFKPKYAVDFFFGVEHLAGAYIAMWKRFSTNKIVAAAFPNDSDGNVFRAVWPGFAKKAGYTLVVPPPYTDGATDYTSLISAFKAGNCELFTNVSLPPDFAIMWKQMYQQGFHPKLATVGKDLLFPSDTYSLGSLANNVAINARWNPVLPYQSSLTGQTCTEYGNDFETTTGGQWIQSMGGSYALFEVAHAVFTSVSDPKDKTEVAATLQKIDIPMTMVGPLDWSDPKNPAPGVRVIFPVGAQWQKGTKYPYDLLVVDNTLNPKVPIQAPLKETYA